MKIHYASVLGAVLASSILSACVTPSSQGVPVDISLRTQQLEQLNDYRVKGGLGIWTDEQSMSARIDWIEQAGILTLAISGPLGIGDMELVSGPGLAILKRGGKVIGSGASADQVVQRGLGLNAPVPMNQLQRWVRGLPGNATAVERDAQGKLSSLRFTDTQGVNWQARFLKYQELDALTVPALITASGGPYSIRLRLTDWQRSVSGVVPDKTQSDTRLAIPER